MIGKAYRDGFAGSRPWNHAIRLRHVAAILAATVMLLITEYSMSETKAPIQSNPSLYCLGRFNFALPAEFNSGGREQRIFLLRVWTETLPPNTDPTQIWMRHLTPIKQPTPSLSTPGMVRDFSLTGVGPAVWYRPSPMYPDDRKLLAMKPGQGFSLFLEASASAGRESVAEQVIAKVVAGFVLGSSEGFCLEHGAFVMRPSKNERARASFVGGGVDVSVQTETVAAPDDGQAVLGGFSGIQVLAKDSRSLDGLTGIEQRVRVTEKDTKPMLTYSWIYPGQTADGLRPRIHLQASATDDRRPALDAAWNTLLDSWRQRPVGVAQGK